MPGGDGTGPMGQGSFTGRGLGNCIAKGIPFIAEAISGICFGRGRRNRQNNLQGRGQGRGFGWRNQQNLKQDNNQ